jgi:transcriptional regulator with XRE-family HTH domain
MLSEQATRDLGDNIRRELAAKGWTQTELARRCGMPPSRINQIISGRYDPRLGTVERIASALCRPLAVLVMRSEEAEPAHV